MGACFARAIYVPIFFDRNDGGGIYCYWQKLPDQHIGFCDLFYLAVFFGKSTVFKPRLFIHVDLLDHDFSPRQPAVVV